MNAVLGDDPEAVIEDVQAEPVADVVEATPEPVPEPVAAAPVAPPEPGHVPISAMLDEREKRQALERQVAELRARQEPPAALEPTEALQVALYNQNLKVSRKFADRQYGAELTATVHDWAESRCDADPIFNQQMRTSDDPYESAMQAYNREQIVTKVTPDRFAAFEAWEAAQSGIPAPNQIIPPSTPRTPPPRSLVNAPGSGSNAKDAPMQSAYDALDFK